MNYPIVKMTCCLVLAMPLLNHPALNDSTLSAAMPILRDRGAAGRPNPLLDNEIFGKRILEQAQGQSADGL